MKEYAEITKKNAGAAGTAPTNENISQSDCTTISPEKQLVFQLNDKADYAETELTKARTILEDLYEDYFASELSGDELQYLHNHGRTLCEIVDDYLIRAEHFLQELHALAGYPK